MGLDRVQLRQLCTCKRHSKTPEWEGRRSFLRQQLTVMEIRYNGGLRKMIVQHISQYLRGYNNNE